MIWFPYPVSLSDPAELTGCASSSPAHLPDLLRQESAANSILWWEKMEALALEAPDIYHPEGDEERDEDRLVDQVDKERVPP